MKYKYDPEMFNGISNLSEELSVFYTLLDQYEEEKSTRNKLFLQKHGDDLFFTIKHRELEGCLSKTAAEELRMYMRELLYDRL